MPVVEFVKKDGSVVEFHTKPKRKVSDSRLTPYQRLVRKVSAAHPELHGKQLFKKVSKVYRSKKASHEKSAKKSHAKSHAKKSHVKKSHKKSHAKKSGKRSH